MITRADIDRVVHLIVARYDPDRIYLFGSHAKGTATEHSDLDLVVIRPTDLPRGLRGSDVLTALTAVGFGIDVLFVTPEELADELTDPYSMFSTIMPHAKPIYERSGAGRDVPHAI